MGMGFSLWSDKICFLKKLVMITYNSVNILKTTELYTLKG